MQAAFQFQGEDVVVQWHRLNGHLPKGHVSKDPFLLKHALTHKALARHKEHNHIK